MSDFEWIDVKWRGTFDTSGYGIWGSKLCKVLVESGKYRVKPVPTTGRLKEDSPFFILQDLQLDDPISVDNLIPLFPMFDKKGGYCTCTELRRPPEEQIINLEKAKFVLALSKFSTNAYKKVVSNPKKVFPVNFPMFRGEYSPKGIALKMPNLDKYKFKFLTVARIDVRKNLEVLLKAFSEEFGNSKDVCLLVKIGSDAHCVPKWLSDQKPPDNIFWVEDFVKDMSTLYRSVNAYVCADLGEAWSGPTQEAMLCGLPTIAPRHSGHLDYMNDDNSYLVDVSEWMPIGYRNINLYTRLLPPHGMVKYPDVEHLKKTMRTVYNIYGDLSRKEVINHQTIKNALKTQELVDEPMIIKQLTTAFDWISKNV